MAKQNAIGVPASVDIGGTGSTSFTAGSVPFSNGTIITEDNANLFWDDTNNRLGIGTTTPIDELSVVGAVDLIHTSTESDDHALEIEVNAAGFTDVKAIEINYVTGNLTSTGNDAIISINVDETGASGGELFGVEVLSTAIGSVVKAGLKIGTGIGAVSQSSGTFGDADSILNKAVDVTAALANGGAGNISVFVADNDTVTIGDAAKFEELEIILNTAASGAGIAPTFEYSTGVGTWATFGPIDGTNGLRNTGNISWQLADVTGWMTSGGEYLLRWTRTRNALGTTPIIDEIQIAADVEFLWDKNGDVNLNSLTLLTPLVVSSGGTGAATFTDNALLRGQVTGALSPSTVLVSDAGIMTNTSQPAFFAYLTSTTSNITGDGTTYVFGDTDLDSGFTEVFDQGSDFVAGSSTGAIFTAPVTGRYAFYCAFAAGTVGGSTDNNFQLVSSNGTLELIASGAGNSDNSGGSLRMRASIFIDMDAADTAFYLTNFGGGTKVIDFLGGRQYTSLAGYLVC
jgi:hypothetical protein